MNYTEELGKLADHQSRMLKNVSIDEMLAMSQAILDAKRIYVAGWGRAGNNIKMLSMDCSQIGLHTHIVGDNSTPSIHEGDILVIGSGSGKTASMQLFAKQAKSHGAKVGLIVGAIGSPIEEMADLTVHIVDDTHTNGSYRATKGVLTDAERLVHADAFYPVMQTVCDFIRAICAEKLGDHPGGYGLQPQQHRISPAQNSGHTKTHRSLPVGLFDFSHFPFARASEARCFPVQTATSP